MSVFTHAHISFNSHFFWRLYLELSGNKYGFVPCALTVLLCRMSYFGRTGVASELLSLLPGRRLKLFHHCMVGACCKLKMFCIFLRCICVLF